MFYLQNWDVVVYLLKRMDFSIAVQSNHDTDTTHARGVPRIYCRGVPIVVDPRCGGVG